MPETQQLSVADIRNFAQRMRKVRQPKTYSMPLCYDIRLTVSGVVWILGFGMMHPGSFKDVCGNAAYRELERRPRFVMEYDEMPTAADVGFFSGGLMHAEFEVHLLNPEGIAKANRLATFFDELLTDIEALIPAASFNGRELALVRTKLEEASFFAKKAMAKLKENQK